jgi:hypothetical protein
MRPALCSTLREAKGTTSSKENEVETDDTHAQEVTRQELSLIPAPPSTDTHKPLRHSELVSALEEALSFRHIQITAEEYCIAKDGIRLFGCWK